MSTNSDPHAAGQTIKMTDGKLNIPDNPIIPFIEGDGTGPDIWYATQRVLDGAVRSAYGESRKIAWHEVYAGEKAFDLTGEWLPQATLDAMKTYLVGGAVRDALLNYPVTERDWVVVGASPGELLQAGYQQVGKDFPVFLHPETKEEHALARTERKTAAGYKGFEVHASPDVTLEDE